MRNNSTAEEAKFKQYQDENFGEVASWVMRSRIDGATEMFLTDIYGNKKEIITLPDGKKIIRQTEYVKMESITQKSAKVAKKRNQKEAPKFSSSEFKRAVLPTIKPRKDKIFPLTKNDKWEAVAYSPDSPEAIQEERQNSRKDLKARIQAMDRVIKKQIVERDKLAQELHDVGKNEEGVNAQLSKLLGNARVSQLTVGAAHPYVDPPSDMNTDDKLPCPMMFFHADDQVSVYAHSLESAYGLAVMVALVNEFSEGEVVEDKEDLSNWDQVNARAAISLANTGLKKLAEMSVAVYVWGVQCSHGMFIPIIQKCFGDLDDFDQMYYRNTLEHQKFPVVVYRGALTSRVLKARVVMASFGIDAEILLSGHERRSYPDPVKRKEYKRVEEGDIMRELNEL